jgi:hypothetical protein
MGLWNECVEAFLAATKLLKIPPQLYPKAVAGQLNRGLSRGFAVASSYRDAQEGPLPLLPPGEEKEEEKATEWGKENAREKRKSRRGKERERRRRRRKSRRRRVKGRRLPRRFSYPREEGAAAS